VRRKLYLAWIGHEETCRRVEYELARQYGVSTEDVSRMLRAEARYEHQQLFFARAPKAA
jgi:hypothetical protein